MTIVQGIAREPVRCREPDSAVPEAIPQLVLLAAQPLERSLLCRDVSRHLPHHRRNRSSSLCSPHPRPVIDLFLHRNCDVLHPITVTTRLPAVNSHGYRSSAMLSLHASGGGRMQPLVLDRKHQLALREIEAVRVRLAPLRREHGRDPQKAVLMKEVDVGMSERSRADGGAIPHRADQCFRCHAATVNGSRSLVNKTVPANRCRILSQPFLRRIKRPLSPPPTVFPRLSCNPFPSTPRLPASPRPTLERRVPSGNASHRQPNTPRHLHR